ncbi:MAG: hypothetical protein GY853_09205 [PVC group bacterium]|nr:hypothetical protein [PVC group bacterium]
MKIIGKNWEKISFLTMFFLLLIVIASCARETSSYKEQMARQLKILGEYPGDLKDWQKQYLATAPYSLQNIEEVVVQMQAQETKRNIFAKFKKRINKTEEVFVPEPVEKNTSKTPVLEVLTIEYKPVGIDYLGRIVFDDEKGLVAQVNFKKHTYLVRVGSKIGGYTVSQLDPECITLESEDSKTIKIEFRKAAYSKSRIAKIKEYNSQRTLVVSKDSEFFGYKVLDILEDHVLVSKQGQHLKLEKGMVHK